MIRFERIQFEDKDRAVTDERTYGFFWMSFCKLQDIINFEEEGASKNKKEPLRPGYIVEKQKHQGNMNTLTDDKFLYS
jgi:hypothetical protein